MANLELRCAVSDDKLTVGDGLDGDGDLHFVIYSSNGDDVYLDREARNKLRAHLAQFDTED